MAPIETFEFRFAPAYRLAGSLFGLSPRTTQVMIGDDQLKIRFGPWRLETDLSNVIGAKVTGPYTFLKAAGPARLSLVDRGITFATNGDRGVCICFRTPVPALDPLHLLRHPAVTVTVADTGRLADRLATP